MKRHRRASRGFTLIEIMVSAALLTVVCGLAMTMVVGMNGSSQRVRIIGDAQTTGRTSLDALAADIRSAGGGVASGAVGVAPGAGNARRIPVIYSGPTTTVTEPGGQTIVSNSLFIVTTEPATVGIPADATGMQGAVVSASSGTPLTVICSNGAGTTVDCRNGLLNPLAPLLVGDFHNAVYLTPTTVAAPTGTPATQQLDYAEKASNAYSPDPKAPFGFVPGANISKARVVHWYLWQPSPTATPQLRRSFPALTSSALSAACASGDVPFKDETNDASGLSPTGRDMGAGPVESLQIRFVVDASGSDTPSSFTMLGSIGICDVGVPATLREVRLQVVGMTKTPDLDQQQMKTRALYSTPGFEGVTPSATTADGYPRRAFTVGVVPRALQGARL